jgi:hypothetical protein
MNETYLIVKITHKKPLPEKVDITDIAGQRLYAWLYSQGVEASVRASLVPQKPETWERQA